VGLKIKAKVWVSEYVEFGASLTSTPQFYKYALPVTTSYGPAKQPQLTHEPYHAPKVTNRTQWVLPFNTFVLVYTEQYQSETPQ